MHEMITEKNAFSGILFYLCIEIRIQITNDTAYKFQETRQQAK